MLRGDIPCPARTALMCAGLKVARYVQQIESKVGASTVWIRGSTGPLHWVISLAQHCSRGSQGSGMNVWVLWR